MYPRLFLIRYGKTGRHRNVHEEEADTHRSLKTGGKVFHARPPVGAPGWVRRQKEEEEVWAQVCVVVSLEKVR